MQWLDRRTVKKYSSGKKVTVHYNPDDPEDAVLEAGIAGSSVFLFLMGVTFFGAGGLCFTAFRKKLRHKA